MSSLLSEQGRWEEVEAAIAGSMSDPVAQLATVNLHAAERTWSAVYRGRLLAYEADALAELGRFADAAAAYQRARECMEPGGFPWLVACDSQGLALERLGSTQAALDCWIAGVAVVDQLADTDLGVVPLLCRIALDPHASDLPEKQAALWMRVAASAADALGLPPSELPSQGMRETALRLRTALRAKWS